MTINQTNVLIFKDQASEYFLLPQETLEQGRVPAAHEAKVECLVAEAGEDDVAGHILPAVGVLTMPAVVADFRQLAEDTKLLDWIGSSCTQAGRRDDA